ncbi:MAG: preprotein translocase subunit YajC [Treponema sp.]|nr:preprotein translocase subunit YajC [Treponema sp.]
MSFVSLLQAGASTTSNFAMSVMPFVLIIIIFYFFIIRPQNKKQKETEQMLKALKKGDKVITIGGIHGVISSVKENVVVVKVDDNAKIEFTRSAIATVVVDKHAEPAKDKKAAKEEKKEAADTAAADSSTENK